MPKDEDLLGPIGHPGADHIRTRLRTRVLRELGITMRKTQIRALLSCLDKKASFERIRALHDEALAETLSPVWHLEMEPLLTESHGAWRYEGKREVLLEDITRSAGRYAVMHAMDALLSECGFPVVRTRPERMDDAAWYAVRREER
jgi:hypothetical protein